MEREERRHPEDGSGPRYFRQKNLGIVIGVVGLLLVTIISWFALDRIEARTAHDVGDKLQNTLKITHNAVGHWAVDRISDAHHIVDRPDTVSSVRELIALHSTGVELKKSSALIELRKVVGPVLEEHGFLGFFVVTPDRVNIASMRDANLNETNLLDKNGDYLDRIFMGEDVLVLPTRSDVPLPGVSGELASNESTMFVGVPVLDESGAVIAAFTIRIDPAIYFTRTVQMARTGHTGDTYAFNRLGFLVTESRFDATLRELGLIGDQERSILNLQLKDPGGDLTKGYSSGVARDEQPLTYMAEEAVAGRDGVDTQGYRDYRGVPVVGAWRWDKKYGFGLAAEIDVAEAYASYYEIRNTVLWVLGVTAIIFFGLSLSITVRNRRLTVEVFERRRAEDEVHKLSRVVEQSPSTVVITDLKGNIEYVNPKFTELTGYTLEEVFGRSTSILKSGETTDAEYKELWERITSGRVWKGEFHNKKKNGELYWESASISPVKNTAGEVTHYIGLKEDITRRRRNEAELAEYRDNLEVLVENRSRELQREALERQKAEGSLVESEAQVRVLLDSTAEAIYGIDLDGNCTFANPACAKLLGYDTPEELLGLNMHDTIHHTRADGKPYPVEECSIYKAFLQGEGTHCDTELLWRKDGSGFPAEFWSYPIRKDSEVTGSVVTFFDITERVEASEALLETERRMKMAQSVGKVGTWDWNIVTGELIWSDEIYNLFDLVPGEVTPTFKLFNDYVHPDDRELMQSSVAEAVELHRSYRVDMRIINRDGVERVCEARGEVSYAPDGTPLRMLGTFHDITERKRAEGEIKKAFSLNVATLESTADGILVVDMESGFSGYNKKFLEMWKIPDSLMDEGDDSKVIDSIMEQLKDPEGFVRKIKELYSNPEADSFDILEFTDGRVWERYSRPQRLGAEIAGRVWSFRDITERVALEKSLIDSEGLLKEAQQIAIMGHWELFIPTGELYWSDETYRIFDLVPQQFDATYEAFLENTHPDDRDLVNSAYSDSVSSKVPYDITHRLLMADGTVKTVNEKCRTEYSDDGTPLRSVGTIQDITERVQLEEESMRAQKLESVGLLAGGIAHDFNNLLTAIIGNLSIAQFMVEDDDKVGSMLEKSEAACRRAAELTRHLLVFAKGGEPVKSVFSIASLASETVDFALKGSGIKEEMVIADGLWAVEADEGQVSQVLNNLVINAKQAMNDSGVIRVECANVKLTEGNPVKLSAGDYVQVSVEDTGPGMEHEVLQKIFDPYFTTKETGTGLGLATSYKILERHGGHISVESTPGVGTTFTLLLPARSGSAGVAPKVQEEIKTGKGRVLVMDDDESIRDLATVMLEHSGYEPVAVAEGLRAVDAFREAKEGGVPFAAVLMDLTVKGGMGGKEATERILAVDPGAVIIASSGYLNNVIMADHKKYGFAGVLPKPYTALELSRVLFEALEQSHGQTELNSELSGKEESG
ncbi:MAG: PAS domain S-box protein [Proteobacteria bacterium]|nr:PAS domain S-box protein [Pseudomonadota bacterium]